MYIKKERERERIGRRRFIHAEFFLSKGNFVELHYGDPLEGYSLHVKADTTLKKHGFVFLHVFREG